MNLTGVDRSKADNYLKLCQGNMGKAYELFQRHSDIIDEFAKENHIDRKQAESYLEVANYDKKFAGTFLPGQING
jgi:alanyl-tRNA synthetase